MRTRSIVFTLLLVLTMLLAACYPPATPVPPARDACVSGAVTFSGNQALPEGAVARVQVNDTRLWLSNRTGRHSIFSKRT